MCLTRPMATSQLAEPPCTTHLYWCLVRILNAIRLHGQQWWLPTPAVSCLW
jgi:hypothetical protein